MHLACGQDEANGNCRAHSTPALIFVLKPAPAADMARTDQNDPTAEAGAGRAGGEASIIRKTRGLAPA